MSLMKKINNRGTGETLSVENLSQVAASSSAPKTKHTKTIFSVALFVVFFIALLTSLYTGVKVYTNATASQNTTNSHREGMTLVTNIVRANDSSGVVAVGNGPEGKSLVMKESNEAGSYETRLYLYQGNIVQEYSLASDAYTPGRASVVTASKTFDFTYENDLLTIVTDQGKAEISLRYLQGSN